MTFLIALLVWILILGLIFSTALYAINQWPAAQPFKGVAIAVLCLIAILCLVGFVTGELTLPWYEHRR